MQNTPLYPVYQKYQAKVVDFHGWNLPVQFAGIIQEHLTVRNRLGLFDVSHMGEIWIEGDQAQEYLDYVLPNQISTLKPGSIRYSPLCFEHGGTVDDLLVYAYNKSRYMLVVNAANISKDYQWLLNFSRAFKVTLRNISELTAQLAIQGPLAIKLLQQICDAPLSQLKYYQFLSQVNLEGKIQVLISRTGYTGEDGFEIYVHPEQAIDCWEILMQAGSSLGIEPIGLGARDTLRFEACLPLYGNELADDISPLEAGLERFIKFEKPSFIGKKALLQQKLNGVTRSLAGVEMVDRGIPRSGCRIVIQGEPAGYVTSGNYCPSLKKNMALALIDHPFNKPGLELQVDIRGKLTAAKVVNLPFYFRKKGESR